MASTVIYIGRQVKTKAKMILKTKKNEGFSSWWDENGDGDGEGKKQIDR
jgi:hypothetical protein